jgi:hypothetical protein
MFQKLFSIFGSSKRRKIPGTKRSKASGKSFGKRSTKRRTRRVYKMRGGWGPPTPGPFMKGGWGGAITSPNPV